MSQIIQKQTVLDIKTYPTICYEFWQNNRLDLESILYSVESKSIKDSKLNKFTSDLIPKFELQNLDPDKASGFLHHALDEFISEIVKNNILENEKRVDGRALNETRKISSQINVLSEPHGSSLFQRGETQVLNILTLGTLDDALLLDGIEDIFTTSKRYLHHYNFPPYSVGETGRYNGTGRREIGHGNLAEKALLPVIPNEDTFPYTIRLVSECLGSNGSTSMASTCASTLSLMAGGVPIKDMVAGVAMGLAINKETGVFKVLTDIQGLEDHHADMDFKVTGTIDGITAIQLDNKVGGMPVDVLISALHQAKEGRIYILNKMKETISIPKSDISESAPKVMMIIVPESKIRDVIGSGGAIINGMQSEFGVEISLENESGKTSIYGKNQENVLKCFNHIKSIIREFQTGEILTGVVVRIEKFGAFFKVDGTEKDAMIHISALGGGKRLEKVEDVLNIGNRISCTVNGIDQKNGKVLLSFNGIIS
jgi:polyribonucleotide nucleotidyltransferase